MNTTPSIHPKVSAGLFGGSVASIAIGLLNRYTAYHPTPEEIASIAVIFGSITAWIVPADRQVPDPTLVPVKDVLEALKVQNPPTPAQDVQAP